MTAERQLTLTPAVQAALGELKCLIARRFPQATFTIEEGFDPVGIYLVATVDIEDTDEVVDIYGDRLLDLQVEEGLAVYVATLRPVDRVVAALDDGRASAPLASLPV